MWFGAEVPGPPCEHRGQAPAPCPRRPPGSCAAAVACPANMLQVLLVLLTRVQHRGARKPGPELCQCQRTCSLPDSRWDHHILRNDILLHRTADCRRASVKPTYKWTRLKFSQLESHRHTFSKLLDTVQVLNLSKGASLVAQWLRICLPMQGHGFEPWSGKIPHAVEQLGPWATTTEPARL